MKSFIIYRSYWLVFALCASVPMIFALYTNNAWDDWYITYRASKNLALGNGLVFTVGEHVHSFTSPLGTLIPAAISFLTGNSSDNLVLWLYRLFNSLLLGVTAVMLLKVAKALNFRPWATILLIGMFALDGKTLAFSINGMETAILIFFLVANILIIVCPPKLSAVYLGLTWGGLMWTRPDGFIYVLALCAGFLFFDRKKIHSKFSEVIRRFFVAGLIATITYLPWLIWAWSYYGSFIPHTITAKGLYYSGGILDSGIREALHRLLLFSTGTFSDYVFANTFMPPYAINFGGWPTYFFAASKFLSWICAFAWFLPFLRSTTRALSFAVLIAQIYLNIGMPFAFPWYLPPAAILTIIVFALIVDQALELSQRTNAGIYSSDQTERRTNLLAPIFKFLSITALVTTLSITLASAYVLRIFQDTIYQQNYTKVGLWLKEHASSDKDRVFLEPLGYIGFFSNLKMLDYPGLSSPEMVLARKQFPAAGLGNRAIFANLIAYMKPDWIVLRPREIELAMKERPGLLTETYVRAQEFNVSNQISSETFLPGRGWFKLDQTFVVFKRRD